ncbi:MAG: DMT family transporter [Cellvibrionaceae bacterium]
MNSFFLLSILALIVGALIPVQAATNAALSHSLGNILYPSLVVFAVGLCMVATAILVMNVKIPPLTAFASAPVYGYLGGFVVGSYVLSITYLAPRIGVGNAICFIVTGQILAAVIIDHFGLFKSTQVPISKERLLGMALMIIGLFLARK